MGKRQQRRERGRLRGVRMKLELAELRSFAVMVESASERIRRITLDLLKDLLEGCEVVEHPWGVSANPSGRCLPLPAPMRSHTLGQRQAEEDAAALRLARLLPHSDHDAHAFAIVREHGPEFANRVGDLMLRGWDLDHAVSSLLAREGRLTPQTLHLPPLRTPLPLQDTGIMFSNSGAAVVAVPRHFSNPCHPIPYPRRIPRHGTPSSFGEVCGDEAAAKHQPVLTPCSTCRNHDDNPWLACAMHPLERPGHECSDWEDRDSEAAQDARFEAESRRQQAEREARERRRDQAVRGGIAWAADAGRRVAAMQASWPVQTVDDDYAEMQMPFWERPEYRWLMVNGARVEVGLRRLLEEQRWVLAFDDPQVIPSELMDGDCFGLMVTYGVAIGNGNIPIVRWCPQSGRFECEPLPGSRLPIIPA